MSSYVKAIVLAILATTMIAMVAAAPPLTLKWVKNTSELLGVAENGRTRWGSHVTYDFDGDGKREIVYGAQDIKRVVCTNFDGSLRWVWPALDQEPWADMLRPACIADLDQDGTADIVFCSRSPDAIASLTADGQERFNFVQWKGNTGSFAGGPIARDFYPDIPGLEITFGGKFWWAMLQHDGTEIWQVDLASDTDYVPNAQDIDGDGEYEILVVSRGTSEGLRVLSAKGVEEWRFGGAGVHAGSMWYQPTICDINNDGEWEILLSGTDSADNGIPTGGIYCLNWYGQELWSFDLPADQSEGKNIRCQPAVGDVDEDGFLEVAFQSGEPGYFYVLEHDGSLKWKKNTATRVGYGCSIADVNGDGHLEILLGSYDKEGGGILYVWDKDGTEVYEPWNATAAGYEGPVSIMAPEVCDLEGDGKVDILWNWYTSDNHGYFAAFTTGADVNPDGMVFPRFGATADFQGMPQLAVLEPIALLFLALIPIGAARMRKG
jgi:hypothetical protein